MQAASSSRRTYSSARCARVIEPGPQTTAGIPIDWNSPPSVPNDSVVSRSSSSQPAHSDFRSSEPASSRRPG